MKKREFIVLRTTQSVLLLCINITLMLNPPQTVEQHIPNHSAFETDNISFCFQHPNAKSNIFQLGFSPIISHKTEVTHLKYHKMLWKVPTSSMTFASRKINKDVNCNKKSWDYDSSVKITLKFESSSSSTQLFTLVFNQLGTPVELHYLSLVLMFCSCWKPRDSFLPSE